MNNKLINKILRNSQASEIKQNSNPVKDTNKVKRTINQDKVFRMMLTRKSSSLSCLLGEVKRKKELEKNNSYISYNQNTRLIMVNAIKEYMKISITAGIKYYIVKLGDITSEYCEPPGYTWFTETINELLVSKIDKLELVENMLLTSNIPFIANSEKPIVGLTIAIIGIRSVIGYNPYLSNMIYEQVYDAASILEVEEVNNIEEISEYLYRLNDYAYKLLFKDYNQDTLYLAQEIDSEFYTTEYSEYETGVKMRTAGKKNSEHRLDILIDNNPNNIGYEKSTVMTAIITYLRINKKQIKDILEIDKQIIINNLKNKYPEQLKYIDLTILFDIYYDKIKDDEARQIL